MISTFNQKILPRFFFLLFLFLLAWPVLAQAPSSQEGKPLSLDQCIDMALKYHPSLRASQATIDVSKARVEEALANYYPQINLNASYSDATANLGARTNKSTFFDSFAMGPTLSQNIYDFGRTANTVKINRENVAVSEQNLATTKQIVVLNVKQAYFGVLQTLRLVKVAEDTVNQMKSHLAQAQAFFQAGTVPKIDVTKAEVDLANAQLAQIQANNNYLIARVTLNNALGLREDLSFAIEDNLVFEPYKITLEEILKAAYTQRPEILQLIAQERGQDAAIKLAQSSYYPILSGNASYLLRRSGLYKDESDIDINLGPLYWDLSLGVTLSIPIFSGFSSPNQVAEARASLLNLQAQEENLKLNIRLEGDQAYLNLKKAEEQIQVSQKALTQAEENFQLATGRYQVGVGSPLEITDAEVSLANAKANNIQALYNYKIAIANIEKAMGLPVAKVSANK